MARFTIELRPGDLIVSPAWMVHRDVTGPGQPREALVVRFGQNRTA